MTVRYGTISAITASYPPRIFISFPLRHSFFLNRSRPTRPSPRLSHLLPNGLVSCAPIACKLRVQSSPTNIPFCGATLNGFSRGFPCCLLVVQSSPTLFVHRVFVRFSIIYNLKSYFYNDSRL